MEICSIASGSSGNCICAGTQNCHLMIDAGISGKRIEAALSADAGKLMVQSPPSLELPRY